MSVIESTSKAKSLVPTRFQFNIHVQEVKPWKYSDAPLVLLWQRGRSRSGVSPPIFAALENESDENGPWKLQIDAHFRVSATLYSEELDATPDKTPLKYKRKNVVFKLHEAELEPQVSPKGSSLGRFILDLSAFGNLSSQEIQRKTLPLVTSSFCEAFDPSFPTANLVLTIQCMTKKLVASSTSLASSRSDALSDLQDTGDAESTSKCIEKCGNNDDARVITCENEDRFPTHAVAMHSNGTEEDPCGVNKSDAVPVHSNGTEKDACEVSKSDEVPVHSNCTEEDVCGVNKSNPVLVDSSSTEEDAYSVNKSGEVHVPSSYIKEDAYRVSESDEVHVPSSCMEEDPFVGKKSDEMPVHSSSTEEDAYRVSKLDEVPVYSSSTEEDAYRVSKLDEVPVYSSCTEEDGYGVNRSDAMAVHSNFKEEDAYDYNKYDEVPLDSNFTEEDAYDFNKYDEAALHSNFTEEDAYEFNKYDAMAMHSSCTEEDAYGTNKMGVAPFSSFDQRSPQSPLSAYSARDIHDERLELEEERENLQRDFKLLEAMRNNLMEEKERISEMALEVVDTIEKATLAEERAKAVEMKYRKMPREVRDASLAELAVYSVCCEHGGNCASLHTPARRLARVYLHSLQHEVFESVKGVAETMVSSILLAARAAGKDIPRLVFWLSNAAMLREIISQMIPIHCMEKNAIAESTEYTCDTSPHASFNPGSAVDQYDEDPVVIQMEDLTAEIQGSWNEQDEYDYRKIDQEDFEWRNHANREHGQGGCSPHYDEDYNGHDDPFALDHHSSRRWNDPTYVCKIIFDIEKWLHYRILNLIWTQSFIPLMTIPLSERKRENGHELREPPKVLHKSNMGYDMEMLRSNYRGADRWRVVFIEIFRHLCPSRWLNAECGCIFHFSKQIIRQCAAKLDVAIFNALLRGEDNWKARGSEVDPILDPHALPLPYGHLTFNHGIELKIAISTWSDVLLEIESRGGTLGGQTLGAVSKDNCSVREGMHSVQPSNKKDMPQAPKSDPKSERKSMAKESTSDDTQDFFPLLKSMADLLMLPKDLLLDPVVRKEACGSLSSHLIRRIVFLFVPDGNTTDYVSPSLLAALNTEVKLSSKGINNSMDLNRALWPSLSYVPPASDKVRILINHFGLSVNTNMELVIDKGETSDDDVSIAEDPLSLLYDDHHNDNQDRHHRTSNRGYSRMNNLESRSFRKSMGYKLLKRLLIDHEQSLVFE